MAFANRVPVRRRSLFRLAVALGLAAMFAYTADEILENEWSRGDTWILLHVHGLASPLADGVMRGFTFLGSGVAIVLTVAVLSAWCVRRRQTTQAAWLVGVAATAALANLALKLAFARARPELWQGALHLETYSFPSGHAMSSIASLGMAAVVIGRLVPRARVAAWVVAAPVVLGVGVSRVYLGAHWPSDVLAGWCAGGLLLLAGASASSRSAKRRHEREPFRTWNASDRGT
jgi:membrane-associated phospholipid phosphatase